MESQKSSTESSQKIIKKDGDLFISKYEGKVDRETISRCSAKIKASFPALPLEFYEIFADRVIDKGFSNEQLIDSVNNVIDNCIYPSPTTAQFISYDQKIRLYTYQDMLKLAHEANVTDIFKYYDKKKIGERIYWFRKEI
jgi:hypothetical protein